MELKKDFPSQDLIEAGQTSTNRFFWVRVEGDEFIPETSPFKCRDYFNELWYKWQYDITLPQVYGFSSEFVSKDNGKNIQYIGMEITNSEELSNFKNNFHFLNECEASQDVPVSTIVLEESGYFIIAFSRKWMDNPTLFYIYHWLLRLLTYQSGEEKHPMYSITSGTDGHLLKAHGGKVIKLLEKPFTIFGIDPKINDEINPEKVNPTTYHNGAGANSLITRMLVKKTDPFVKAVEGIL